MNCDELTLINYVIIIIIIIFNNTLFVCMISFHITVGNEEFILKYRLIKKCVIIFFVSL